MIEQHMKNSRRQLGELAVMQNRVTETERRILARAEARLDEVNAEIDQLRPQALSQSERYQNLIQERGQLHQVIAHSRKSI